MPLSCPGENALSINVRLDVCRTAAATVTAERRWAGVVCKRVRVAHHSAHRLGQLELVDLVLHVSHAVASDGVEDLLRLLGHSLLDCSGVDRAVVIDGVDTTLGSAAAVCELGRQRVVAVLNGVLRLREVAEVLVADRCEALAGLHKLRLHHVVHAPDLVSQVVEIHGVAQTGLSYGLLAGITVATEAVTTPTEDHREEDDHLPCIVAAEAGLAGSGRDVGK